MSKEFRFFDSRQKYLLFVTTTNEKTIISQKISALIKNLNPQNSSIDIFDAGLGDGTLLMNVLRNCHMNFPEKPIIVFGKEISMEDVRLTIEKLPDRFVEHPNLIILLTNLNYSEASNLTSFDSKKQKNFKFKTISLKGDSSYQFSNQLNQIDGLLKNYWEVEKNIKTGNFTYKNPSALVIYRKDMTNNLKDLIPINNKRKYFDLIIASQPYRSRISVEKKVNYVVKPMMNSLKKNGQLALVHSCGQDPAEEVVKKIWPNKNSFPSLSNDIITYLKKDLNAKTFSEFDFQNPETFNYELKALPNEIDNGIATSLIFSSWNAITYVNQINDKNIYEIEKKDGYLKPIKETIKKYGGIWFNDEMLVIKKVK
ncbi:MAG: hypothetical protein CFH19_01224 [Alphaproteobacteria bacterium MarineAlpha5_Bin9]|nr:MAG: hypothetical protein CFH19_01224 [Alphaproteobacteria bacterium MarineAlpha5_Bin9]|tara:strand:+ start:1372 stop:2478 length:1107 start_codon:yes stop_codon:yes gene_type:complete